jgi:hypothetical protein
MLGRSVLRLLGSLLLGNIFQDIYIHIYIVVIVKCTDQKSSASESASATRALSRSCLSCFSAGHFDFGMHFFEGPGSSSINSTSRVPNSMCCAPIRYNET